MLFLTILISLLVRVYLLKYISLFEQKIFKYSIRPLNVESRFIRLRANNINKCPEYHPGSGGKSWLFTDEIVIN